MTVLPHTHINYNGHKVDIAFTFNPQAYRRNCNVTENVSSQEYIISGLVLFQLKLESTAKGANQLSGLMTYNLRLFVKFNKSFSNDDETYAVKFIHQGIQNVDRRYCLDDNGWREAAADITITSSYEFLITLKLELQGVEGPFKSLYNDDELTDFELSGVDGSIRVHKLVLANQSLVMKAMFSGSWKETSTGTTELPDTNKKTLHNLKRYLYLKELPVEETEILDLLTLGSYYMMSDLKKKCVFNLLDHLSSKNAFNYLEIAIKCRSKKLLLVIMECIKKDIIKTQDIDENCSFEETN